MSEAPPEETTTEQPAQAVSWDELFKNEDPAKVREALDNSRKWETRAKENFEKAKRFDEAEESKKSEVEKAAERIKAAEERAVKAEAEALRFRIANEYKLSQEDAMALEHVASEDGMRTVADRLRAREESQRRTPPETKKLKSGATGGADTSGSRAAAALRQMRGAGN